MKEKFAEIFYRPIVFEEIDRAVWPPSWLGHTPFALWLMESLRPEILVELGTHSGNSFAAFCQGAAYLNYSPSCYAVDTWEGDPHAGAYSEDVYLDVKQYFSKKYGHFSYLLKTTFDNALSNFSDGSVDLLNIDGYHTYEATKENFESWLPKVSRRGVVLIHDTNVRTADFGAWRFWEEIQAKYPSFNFLHSHGLGVVIVGSEIPEPLKFLVDSDSAQTTSIRKFFSSLGMAPALRAESKQLTERVKELEKEVAEFFPWREFGKRHLGDDISQAYEKIESLGRANVEGLSYKLFVERYLGKSIEEAEKSLIAEREEALNWKNFVQGNLNEDIELAREKLDSLGRSNLEGMDYKRFIQRHIAPTLEEALAKLEEVGRSNLEGLHYKQFVENNLASNLEEAGKKLDELKSDSKALEAIKTQKSLSPANRLKQKITRIQN